MNMFRAFMELDRINEAYKSRNELIAELKALGVDYNFDTKSDQQLYRILEKELAKKKEADAYLELAKQQKEEKHTCTECGSTLTDGGLCPKCDDGEEHLNENKLPIGTSFRWTSASGKPIVRIMYTGNKFIARADDGIHGINNVLFINKFNKHNGELYEVDQLIWTGKSYKVAGDVKYVGNIVDKYQQIYDK